MADTYSKLLGLSGSSPPPSRNETVTPGKPPLQQAKKPDVDAKKHAGKPAQKQPENAAALQRGKTISPPLSPLQQLPKQQDSSFLTTKEKTKYGTYLTDESIEKIRIRAIQTKRDDHQILQEAVNQYFDRLAK